MKQKIKILNWGIGIIPLIATIMHSIITNDVINFMMHYFAIIIVFFIVMLITNCEIIFFGINGLCKLLTITTVFIFECFRIFGKFIINLQIMLISKYLEILKSI